MSISEVCLVCVRLFGILYSVISFAVWGCRMLDIILDFCYFIARPCPSGSFGDGWGSALVGPARGSPVRSVGAKRAYFHHSGPSGTRYGPYLVLEASGVTERSPPGPQGQAITGRHRPGPTRVSQRFPSPDFLIYTFACVYPHDLSSM